MGLLNFGQRKELDQMDEHDLSPGGLRPLPPRNAPGEAQRFSPPPMRRDPEIEAMMVSANTLLQLREQVAQLSATNATLIEERARWEARADHYESALATTESELDHTRSFCTELVTQLNTVSVILLDVLRKAQARAIEPSREHEDRGSLRDPAIDESHLKETEQ